LAWAILIFYELPTLKLDLNLADQVVAPHFFVSFLILVFSWMLSGPVVAVVLTVLSVLMALYLSLSLRDPAFLLQGCLYAVVFFFMVSYLYEAQKQVNNKRIYAEKLNEDLHVVRAEGGKKEALCVALEHKIERLLDLQRFSQNLKGMQELGDIASKIVSEIFAALPRADECVLYLVDENKQELSLVASQKRSLGIVKEKQGSLFDQWVMKRCRPIMIEDTLNDFRFSAEAKEDEVALRSLCASPLMTENKVLGVVRASAIDPGIFSSDDLRLIDIIAGLGSVMLRNVLLYEKTEELAIRDSLTGLYLNRYFLERMSEEITRTNLNKTAFSVILLDIDHFKRYNDEYGHSAGDIVLKSIASILLKNLDSGDLAARYGGEELIVLMPNKGKHEALLVAERIRQDIETHRFVLRRQDSRVTASLGVATFPASGRSREQLIRTVDKNLYEAKNLGRNRVCGTL